MPSSARDGMEGISQAEVKRNGEFVQLVLSLSLCYGFFHAVLP